MSAQPDPLGLEPLDAALLSDPLAFLLAEHERQRVVLHHLDWLAKAPPGPARQRVARLVLRFLEQELTDHINDEIEDFLPLLSQRLPPAAEGRRIVTLVEVEHARDEPLARETLSQLRGFFGPGAAAEPTRSALRLFAETQRRHIQLENALLIPLASDHLTADDLAALAARFRQRRG